MGAYARHDDGDGVVLDGGHTPVKKLTETFSFGLWRAFFINWTSMLLSIDTCQNRVSADQNQAIISHIKFMEVMCFLKLDHCINTGFRLDRGLKSG